MKYQVIQIDKTIDKIKTMRTKIAQLEETLFAGTLFIEDEKPFHYFVEDFKDNKDLIQEAGLNRTNSGDLKDTTMTSSPTKSTSKKKKSKKTAKVDRVFKYMGYLMNIMLEAEEKMHKRVENVDALLTKISNKQQITLENLSQAGVRNQFVFCCRKIQMYKIIAKMAIN